MIVDPTEKTFEDWHSRQGEPFEEKAGPFYYREQDDGSVIGAFRAEHGHLNGIDVVHGGCILTLIDYTLFSLVRCATKGGEAVTVSLANEFVGSGALGDLIEAHAEIVKAGGSLIFVRGLVRCAGKPLAIFSGTMKRLGQPRS